MYQYDYYKNNTLRNDELAYASLDFDKKECVKMMESPKIPNVIEPVSSAVRRVIGRLNNGDDTQWGGHIVLLSPRGDEVINSRLYGTGRVTKFEQAQLFAKSARERAERLMSHPKHRSSSQSGPGGAIRCNDGSVLSFEGLPDPAGNEAVVLRAGMELGMLTLDRAREIAQLSNNRFFL